MTVLGSPQQAQAVPTMQDLHACHALLACTALERMLPSIHVLHSSELALKVLKTTADATQRLPGSCGWSGCWAPVPVLAATMVTVAV